MLRTLTLCSGKGGVGKTLLTTTLARIIQKETNGNVLLVDLDVTVRGLTLLTFQNKYALDQVPVSFVDCLSRGSGEDTGVFEELRKNLFPNGGDEASPSLYQRLDKIFVLPSSTESERLDWAQLAQVDLERAIEKLSQVQSLVRDAANPSYLIFDTHAGLGNLSLAATTLSDLNLIVLEEDDVSWRSALNMLLEITELKKQRHGGSRSYFLANKVGAKLSEVSGKLKAFSFLPPVPYDPWMQKLFSHATAATLEKEFEHSDFFRFVHSQVWQEIATILGLTSVPARRAASLRSWWNG
ncbi:MAG: AAA family ATPase [Candidatus Binatia bacterium]